VAALLLREAIIHLKKKTEPSVSATKSLQDNNSSLVGSEHPYTALREKYENCIYMDYNATTPIWPEVTKVMEPFTSSCFGNPSSPHVFAAPCKEAMTVARNYVCQLVNAPSPNSIIFTSCGSEADNRAVDIAVSSFLRAYPTDPPALPHVITSGIEHPAILEYLTYLSEVEKTIEVTILPVDGEGFISPADVAQALRYNTALVSIMHSNNEVGTIQPIRLIGEVVESYNASLRMTAGTSHKVLFHSDGAQSLGKVLIDVQHENIDILTIVGHKFGAPKGIAAMYVKEGIPVSPLIHGGGQEGGRRAGTENVLLMAGLGEASRIALTEAAEMMVHLLSLKKYFIDTLRDAVSNSYGVDFLHFNGPKIAYDTDHLSQSITAFDSVANTGEYFSSPFFPTMLPNTVSVGFKDILASELIGLLRTKVACSAGTTCHACHEETSMSAVLTALQVKKCYGLGTLRISFGRHTTKADVNATVSHVVTAIHCLRSRKK